MRQRGLSGIWATNGKDNILDAAFANVISDREFGLIRLRTFLLQEPLSAEFTAIQFLHRHREDLLLLVTHLAEDLVMHPLNGPLIHRSKVRGRYDLMRIVALPAKVAFSAFGFPSKSSQAGDA